MIEDTIAEAERLGWDVKPTHLRAEKQGHTFDGTVSDVLGRIEAWEEGDHPRSDQLAYALNKESQSKIDALLRRFFAYSREYLLHAQRYEDLFQRERSAQEELDEAWDVLLDRERERSVEEDKGLHAKRDALQTQTGRDSHLASEALTKSTVLLERGSRVLQELLEQPLEALRSHKGLRELVESFDSPEAQSLREALTNPRHERRPVMAEKSRLTRSPRDLRDSTNDAEKFSKGDVQLEQSEPRKSGGPENERAWEQSGYNQREASGWPKGV